VGEITGEQWQKLLNAYSILKHRIFRANRSCKLIFTMYSFQTENAHTTEKQKPAKYFKIKNVFQQLHNHLPRFLPLG
jgi:hypothetical protein